MKIFSFILRVSLVLLVSGGFATTALGAESFNLDAAHSYVLFKVEHLGLANSYGRFNEVSGTIAFDTADPAKSQFKFEVAATSIDTGNDKRDEHLRSGDFFDVANHPTISFNSQRVKVLGKDRFEIQGEITLLGKTRSVTAEVVQTGAGNDPWGNHRRGFESQFSINRSDFGMDHLLTGVGDMVEITVSVEGMRKL